MLVRVFIGDINNWQVEIFKAAVLLLDQPRLETGMIVFEYLSFRDIKERRWGPREVTDFLLDSHAHVLLCSLCQRYMWTNLQVDQIYAELYHHPGFPQGDKLHCPLLTRDKYEYLRPLMSSKIVNPSLKVHLREDDDYTIVMPELMRFLEDNDEGCGWVVKLPFTNNREFVKRCATPTAVVEAMIQAGHRYWPRMNYAILQAWLNNDMEYQVVMICGTPLYVIPRRLPSLSAKRFSTRPHPVLMQWAKRAVEALSQAVPQTNVDGLVRVDILEAKEGNFVVNGFESFDVDINSTDDFLIQCQGFVMLRDHYSKMMERILVELQK